MCRMWIIFGVLLISLCRYSEGGDHEKHPSDKTKTPEVFALLMVNYRQPMLLRDDRMVAANLDEFNLYKRTQKVVVTSNFVILAALRKNDISQLKMLKSQGDRKVRWLAGKLRVDFPNDAEVMRIGMSGENVNEMVRLVNAIVDAYLIEVVDAERAAQLQRRDGLHLAWLRNEEETHKKALVVAKIEAASKERANDIVVELQAAKRDLSHYIRFTERIRNELDQLNVNVKTPSRIVAIQNASE